MKNLMLINKKMTKLVETIKDSVKDENRNIDDIKYLMLKAAEYSDNLKIIEIAIESGEGSVKENDFKDVLKHINDFINGAALLLNKKNR